jgi:hypothetical protein
LGLLQHGRELELPILARRSGRLVVLHERKSVGHILLLSLAPVLLHLGLALLVLLELTRSELETQVA